MTIELVNTQPQARVVAIKNTATIKIAKEEVIATSAIEQDIADGNAIRAQIDALDRNLKVIRGRIEDYMGESTLLLHQDGTKAISWKYTNATVIDEALLKTEHRKVYNQVIKVDASALRDKFKDVFNLVAKTIVGTRRLTWE